MKKLALIIGVKDYTNVATLWNTENDAIDISNFLTSVGFETKLIKNPTQKEIIKEVSLFKNLISTDTVSIIYFAGHGLQMNGFNFLVPSDAKIDLVEEIPYCCVNARDCLIDQTTSSNSIHLLILDACRNNPFSNGLRSLDIGLAKMSASMGTLIAFSTSPNNVAFERKNERNGIYTQFLLKNLQLPNCALERIFKNTRTEVIKSTNGKQVPWEESSLHGEDFYFIKEPTALLYLIRKDLLFAYKTLIEENIEIMTFDGNSIESILQPGKVKMSYKKAIAELKNQWELSNNTKHPSVAFYLIFNLQNIIMATHFYRKNLVHVNFIKLNDIVFQQSNEINGNQLELIHKLLLLSEHYIGIFKFNDKFGNLNSLKRVYDNHIWTGLILKSEILDKQNVILEDMALIRSQEVHLNEFFKSVVLVQIMDEFFQN